jgi:hypothetical protein
MKTITIAPSGAFLAGDFPGDQIALGGDGLGGYQARTGGGSTSGPVVVKTAGSADAVATLYDGTSTSGRVLAVIPLSAAAVMGLPNSGFSAGLYIDVAGTSAASFEVAFS